MNVEIKPLGGEIKVTTISTMIEATSRVDALASFTVQKGDILYIEPMKMGAEVSPDSHQLSFDF